MTYYRTTVRLGLLALLAAAFVSAAAPAQAIPYQGYGAMGRLQPAKTKAEWATVGTVSVPQGTTSEFIKYDCPAEYPVAISGAFYGNGVAQSSSFALGANGPRIDENPPNLNEWGWHFYWASGAPSGTSFVFSVYCSK